MTIANLLWKLLAALMLWPVLAVTAGWIASIGKPYSQADYFLLAVVLGGIGALCEVVYLFVHWWQGQPGHGMAVWAGACCGVLAFSMMVVVMTVSEHEPYRFYDAHNLKLLAFLSGAGAGIAWLLGRLFRMQRRAGGSKRDQCDPDDGEDIHSYVSAEIGGADSHDDD
jgi:hypothetical protein